MNIDKITKKIINIIKNDYLIDLDEDEEMGLTSDIADILQDKYNLAINALEKQIPQKPHEHYHWGEFTKEEKLENNQWFCGKCGWQIGEEDNYCSECGQRIDWS